MAGARFFLGGRDLEMVEIGALVRDARGAEAVMDKALSWSAAQASAYGAEIAAALKAGQQPVLVELRPDLDRDVLERCLEIDHHGVRAGDDRPTSLEQVFAHLKLPAERWTRRLALVSANDRGWIPALRAMGASRDEIETIRRQDRAAQGITEAEERAGEGALRNREHALGDSLIIVRLPHAHVAVVTDRLALEAGEARPPDTLILSPAAVNFSGQGARVRALDAAFPGGWFGGALPAFGFWGRSAPVPPLKAVLAALAGSPHAFPG